MPAPTSAGPLDGALRFALAKSSASASSPRVADDARLEAKLSGGARASLLAPVVFEESGSYHRDPLRSIKAKYLLLRPEDDVPERATVRPQAKIEQENPSPGGLPSPKRTLFPLSSVRHGWRNGWRVGSGMQNIGNTCYLNSTLQALFHVSAFANWLVSENHADKCGHNGGCIICCMRKTLIDTQNSTGPIKPWQVYSNLRSICKHLTPGRQEDAHEFLRYLVEAMEKTYLSRFECSHLDQYSKETTPLNQILGGYLRSVVRCLSCGRVSTTFQHFQDLLVDARRASTIDEALEVFFSREHLEDLGYKCEFCNKKVSATKQFFIERAPMVLCIALKRFSITGGKLTKHVQFKQRLALNKYMHDQNKNSSETLNYRLVSVVTHLGQSQNCGHYTAVGYGPTGSFYQFDDGCVREMSPPSVMNTNAYVIFYELNVPPKPTISAPNPSSIVRAESDESVPNPIAFEPAKTPIISKLAPIGSNSFVKTPLYKPNENGDRNINGTSSSMSSGLNRINYFDRSSSTSTFAAGKLSDGENCPKRVANGDGDPPGAKVSPCGSSDDSKAVKNRNGTDRSNGPSTTAVSSLVPYDSDGDNQEDDDDDEEENDDEPKDKTEGDDASGTNIEQNYTTVATSQEWKVSRENPEDRLNSSSQKHSSSKSPDKDDSQNRSNSSSREGSHKDKDSSYKDKETLKQLQCMSHRGYGVPTSTWNGTHSQLNKQVFEDKKNESKRALEADDEMDRGRAKKMKHSGYIHKYGYSRRHNNYNPFQESQNHVNKWGVKNGFKKFYHHNRSFKHKPRGRFSSHYPRHHSNSHYHSYNNRNNH